MKNFEIPNFSDHNLELRFEDNVVCIYGNEKGLKDIAELCHKLINQPSKEHIHLEDYDILTKKSEKGVIAIF